jgi:hypothetical protein
MNGILWVLIGFLAGVIFDLIWTKLSNKHKKLVLKSKKGHIHHSVLGLVLIIIYLFTEIEFLFAFGLGILISHSARKKSLLFVEYKKKRYF